MNATPHGRILRALGADGNLAAPGPLMLSGLLHESKGVSEGARLTLSGLRHAGLDPVEHDLRPLLDMQQDGRARLAGSAAGVWMLYANPPQATHAMLALDPAGWRSRRRVGYWTWELGRTPAHWPKLARAFHEIWVPSSFVADAFARSGFTTPVRVAPHAVGLDGAVPRRNRSKFAIPADVTVILALGDLHSSAERKNLTGAIEIYRRAFPEAGAAMLIVKTQSDDDHPAFRAAALAAAGERADIRFISGALSREDVRTLIASCDILLSPHRSEGFGISLAEAMLMGVPALATGWSGNLDFMRGLDALLISSKLVPAVDRYGVYREQGQVWAEPDADDAIAKLRALSASPELRANLAAAGHRAVHALTDHWRSDGELAHALRPFIQMATRAPE
jgi:glycosyltransferase involved in cell wall biosynthesis